MRLLPPSSPLSSLEDPTTVGEVSSPTLLQSQQQQTQPKVLNDDNYGDGEKNNVIFLQCIGTVSKKIYMITTDTLHLEEEPISDSIASPPFQNSWMIQIQNGETATCHKVKVEMLPSNNNDYHQRQQQQHPSMLSLQPQQNERALTTTNISFLWTQLLENPGPILVDLILVSIVQHYLIILRQRQQRRILFKHIHWILQQQWLRRISRRIVFLSSTKTSKSIKRVLTTPKRFSSTTTTASFVSRIIIVISKRLTSLIKKIAQVRNRIFQGIRKLYKNRSRLSTLSDYTWYTPTSSTSNNQTDSDCN